MRYLALATDYDGTIAHDSVVDDATLAALERLRGSGRKLILVTGRQLEELQAVFPPLDLFDRVVAENGALLYRPETREEVLLGPAPAADLIQALRNLNVWPLSVGRSIVATVEPFQTQALEAIHSLGLEMQVIFNKGAVMILPSGVNKATGLNAALADLGLSAHNTVGVGDAENDHAFLAACGCAGAVANALPALKDRADFVTREPCGTGVIQLIDMLITDDLAGVTARLARHTIRIGVREDKQAEAFDPLAANILIAGTSGSGKSTLATGILERLGEAGYQYAILDPEGDYAGWPEAVTVGDADHAPTWQAVRDALKKPGDNAVINLLGAALEDRPKLFGEILPHLLEQRARVGRPHCIVIDEMHHLLAATPGPKLPATPLSGILGITVHPASLAVEALQAMDILLVTGQAPVQTVAEFCQALNRPLPAVPDRPLEPGEVLIWRPLSQQPPRVIRAEPPRGVRRRHSRKYAEGNVGPERNFVFTGPDGKLNLRAQNLAVFVQMAEGVDADTWRHHLRNGDVSTWFRKEIKDEELANEAANIEGQADQLPPSETLNAIRDAVQRRYTLPADAPSGEVVSS